MTGRVALSNVFRIAALGAASIALLQCGSDDEGADGTGAAGGQSQGGQATGGQATGGQATGGQATGGQATGGQATGGQATGGEPSAGGAAGAGGEPSPGGAGGNGGAGGAGEEVLHHLYVGCRDEDGTIQHYRISSESGEVTLDDTAQANATTSNFATNADNTFVYIAHADEGRITTFSRDTETGSLTLEDFVTVPGNAEGDPDAEEPYNVDCVDADNPDDPTNPATQTLTITPGEDFVIASNWCANTVLVYEIRNDGTVGDLVQTVIDGAKSHHAVFNSTEEFVVVPYFGSSYLAVYEFDQDTGMLSPVDPLTTEVPEPDGSSGPRHLAFHPTETSWLYSINETGGSISYFHFDDTDGTLEHQETISSLPEDSPFTVEDMTRSGSEIEIDQSGRFLYVSNRVDGVENGSIGVFSIAQDDGTLTPIEWEDTQGLTPRHFSLSPDGKLLVVTNQGSDNMSVFAVDQESGELDLVDTTDVCAIPFFARMIAPI